MQAEALCYGVIALYDWIKDKKYLDAVSVATYAPITETVADMTTTSGPANYSQDHYVASLLSCCLSISPGN